MRGGGAMFFLQVFVGSGVDPILRLS